MPLGTGVGNVIQRIRAARVFGERVVHVIRFARQRINHHIFNHRTEPDRVPNERLPFLRQLDALGVAAAFEIEHTVIAPAVLVVADQPAVWIGGERGLARAAQSEEDRHVAVLADVGRAVHGEHTLLGEHVIKHGEDALLHLAGVLRPADEHNFA
jgi:hypothetical protein